MRVDGNSRPKGEIRCHEFVACSLRFPVQGLFILAGSDGIRCPGAALMLWMASRAACPHIRFIVIVIADFVALTISAARMITYSGACELFSVASPLS